MFEALAMAVIQSVAQYGAKKVMAMLWDHLSPTGHSVVKGILLGGTAATQEVRDHLNTDERWGPVPLPETAQRLASWSEPL